MPLPQSAGGGAFVGDNNADVLQILALPPALQARRVAAQLAALALRDRLQMLAGALNRGRAGDGTGDPPSDASDSDSDDAEEAASEAQAVLDALGTVRVRILDFSPEGDVAWFLDQAGAQNVTLARGPPAAISALSEGQFERGDIVIVVGMIQPPGPREMFEKLLTFISGGGCAVFLHCIPIVIAGLFPETVTTAPVNALTRAAVRLELSRAEHRSLFSGYRNLEVTHLDPLRLSFSVAEEARGDEVEVLARANIKALPEPLFVKLRHDNGAAFVLSTRLLPARRLEDEAAGEAAQKKARTAAVSDWPPSAPSRILKWLTDFGASQTTARAWLAAKKSGHVEAPEQARGYVAFGELLLKLLVQRRRTSESIDE